MTHDTDAAVHHYSTPSFRWTVALHRVAPRPLAASPEPGDPAGQQALPVRPNQVPFLRPSSESTAPLTSDPDDERCRQHADHDAASRAGTPRGTTRGGPPANRVAPRPGASG